MSRHTTDRAARAGDELIIEGRRVGEPTRQGIILKVRDRPGGASYLVRWDDSGHETVLFPGSDCRIKRLGDD